MQKAERLTSRYEFQELLTGISVELMQRPLEEIDSAIENALEKVGLFAGSDRCYIFLFSDDGHVMLNTHEWCTAGTEPQKENLQGLLSEAFPWWMGKLHRFEYIYIPQVTGLPPEASAEKEILGAQDIQSVLVLPMANQGRLISYFGLDWIQRSAELDDNLIPLLQLTGNILFSALNRVHTEKTLWKSEKKYRLLADNTTDFIWAEDMNLNLTYCSPSIKRLTGYTPEEYMAMPASVRLPPETLTIVQEALAEELEIEKDGGGDPDRQRLLILQLRRKNGGTVWVELVANIMRDENGRPVGIVGVSRDITERRQAEERLHRALNGAVSAIGHMVEYRDPYTAGHEKRVASLARAIALEMELPKETAEAIHIAGIIHDLGKIAVPVEILTKPGKLTENEFNLVMEHPGVGYNILKDLEFPWDIARIVHEHHEKLDGSGYPQKLVGDEILLESMILAVADVVEAMATHRPYRPALGIKKALEEISLRRGELFRPDVVDSCIRLFRDKQYSFE